jgi:hypothetical protein
MKTLLSLLLLFALLPVSSVSAEEFDARAVLGVNAGRSVDAAIKRAEKEKRRVLVIALDPDKNGQVFHIEGMFEFEETKKLVKENFIVVATDFKEKTIRTHAANASTERPMYFLFDKDGKLIEKGATNVGGAKGNQIVKNWVTKK